MKVNNYKRGSQASFFNGKNVLLLNSEFFLYKIK